MRPLVIQGIVALSTVSLLYARQIGAFAVSRNRFYFFWDARDSAAVLIGLLLTAAAAVAARQAIARLDRGLLLRAFDHVFVVVLASGMLALVPFSALPFPAFRQIWGHLLFMAVLLGVGVSFGTRKRGLIEAAKIVALVMSPFTLVLIVSVLRFDAWGTGSGAAGSEAPAPSSRAPALALIVFDGWSYARSVSGDIVREELPAMKALARHSLSFRQARSGYLDTRASLPALIYQADLGLEEHVPYWDPDRSGRKMRAPEGASGIFSLAHQLGYSNRLVGYYLPYCELLRGELDTCFAQSHEPKGDHLTGAVGLSILRNLRHLRDPIMPAVHQRVYRRVFSRHWFEMSHRVIDEAARVLSEVGPGTLTFVHLPIPHWPFVFDRDGSYYGHTDGTDDERGPADAASYIRSLEFSDRVLGKMIDSLEESEQFDDMTLIVTSDHAARTLDWSDSEPRRVPLLIRLPGQKQGLSIESPISNNQLAPLIEAALGKRLGVRRALDLLAVEAQ